MPAESGITLSSGEDNGPTTTTPGTSSLDLHIAPAVQLVSTLCSTTRHKNLATVPAIGKVGVCARARHKHNVTTCKLIRRGVARLQANVTPNT